MIDLYYWTTPNGHKITIFLEETGPVVFDRPGEYFDRREIRAGVSKEESKSVLFGQGRRSA